MGACLQQSGHLCGYEERHRPHCFFRAASSPSGATRAAHVCWDRRVEPSPALLATPLGTCAPGLPAGDFQNEGQGVHTACRLLRPPPYNCDDVLLAWRAVAAQTLQPHPRTTARAGRLLAQFDGFRHGVYGAVHIHRRDKTSWLWWGREATPQHACKYADELATIANASMRDVFIAADDYRRSDPKLSADQPARANHIAHHGRRASSSALVAHPPPLARAQCRRAVTEFRACDAASTWRVHVFGNDEPGRGMNTTVVTRLWAELQLLVRATWAVGSYTSNLARHAPRCVRIGVCSI